MPVWLPEPGQPAELAGEPENSLWWRRYMVQKATGSETSAADKVIDGSATLVR